MRRRTEGRVEGELESSGSFLYFTRWVDRLPHGAYSLRRYREEVEVDRDQPGAEGVREVMEHIGVADSIDGRICSDEEEEKAGEEAERRLYAWDHATRAQCFDEQDERHDGQDVVVG